MSGQKVNEDTIRRVLAVEDNAVTRKLLERKLTDWGYEPLLAAEGEEAWTLLQEQENRPRLLLFDWDMPIVSGIELCRRVREAGWAEPVYIIMVTGRDTTSDVVEGLNAGADDYIRKPFDPDELRSRIGVGMRLLDAQYRLARSEKKHRDLVESAHSLILRLSPDHDISFANPFCIEALGVGTIELMGESFTQLLIDPFSESPLSGIPRHFQGVEPLYNCELPCRHASGSAVWIAWSLKAVRDESGVLQEILAIGNDVTERRQAEAELVQQERIAAVSLLAAGVAHQYNNIHTGVLGHAQLLLCKNTLPGEVQESLERIVANLSRATDITKRLFHLTHSQVLQKTAIPIEEVLGELAECVMEEFKHQGVEFVVSLHPTPPVLLDKGAFSQAVLSLLQNAQHALHETDSPTITLRCGERDGAVFAAVEDTGCGIAKEDIDKILLPFFSRKGEHAVGHTPLSKVRGVGLGLALCDAVMREHGGRIEAESTQGEGSRFTLVFPLQGAGEQA